MDIDPALAPILAAMRDAFAPGAHLLEPAEFRARMERMAAAARPPYPPGLEVSDRQVDLDGHRVPVRIYRPLDAGPTGTLLYLHGGGWVGGSVATHDASCAAIARDVPCNVVSVDYRLAPEHPYPAALDDSILVAQWLCGSAAPAWVDRTRLAIGGDSAGANLATAGCLKLRDTTGAVPFVMQALLYPCVDADTERPSYRRNADAPFLDRAMMRWFIDLYLPGGAAQADGYALPLRAASLAGLPPAFVMTAEFDPLLDDGVELAARFVRDGVACDYRIARRLPHGFLRLRTVSAIAAAAYAELIAALGRGLARR
jgi:acetyl esterase